MGVDPVRWVLFKLERDIHCGVNAEVGRGITLVNCKSTGVKEVEYPNLVTVELVKQNCVVENRKWEISERVRLVTATMSSSSLRMVAGPKHLME